MTASARRSRRGFSPTSRRAVAPVALCTVAALALALGACSSDDSPGSVDSTGSGGSSAAPSEDFPRTVSVGDAQVRVKAQPERIAVVSPDAASLVTQLVPVDHIVMLTDQGKDNPDGPVIVPGSASVDPEQILSVNPDLVVVTVRHGQEKDAGAVLQDSGIPVAEFDAGAWSGIDDLLTNLDTLGQLTGADSKAQELHEQITRDRRRITGALDKDVAKPRVLTLMARGGQRMIMPPTTMMNGLVREAGGTVIADETGSHGAAPADPEVIARLNPDVILVEDYRGRGEQDFADLLADPALADVPAVQDHRVAYLPTATTGVSAGARIGEGLDAVGHAVGTLDAQ